MKRLFPRVGLVALVFLSGALVRHLNDWSLETSLLAIGVGLTYGYVEYCLEKLP